MNEKLKPCPFCETLNLIKKYENEEIKNVYSACLVCDSYYKRNYHGRVSYIPEKLNYCPTCGVKLDGGKSK